MVRKFIFLSIFLFCVSITSENDSSFKNDLNSLMDVLESCGCKFIRNGSEHDPKEAREHMERKLKAVDGKIHTIQEFIDHIGSKSSISGKPYFVKFADGKMVESRVWLKEKWEEIVNKKNNSSKPIQRNRKN
ncbi:YfeK family protein [Leptospira noguchii]|uniref:Uncharacterized protein n=2 Tax=Leptospira noguchii TaxID=28182 RepID=M6U998_9LEPT|nr:YfeK family protein [Leptospira noguchii]EKR74557.1 hypothetical protein LEP1GSC041_4597 [Leptospira noguchii str. 2006001870]EMO41070.1 hypothetical protein LEP1GSC186_4725 [Leptospira noguchii serovar Autumnalis str. ZUN142]UOG41103.1 YfeK family protein [Leptospira noguchii]UOG48456.1 YfeK family protein [Leptospira noguchii]UOG56341.1 YfeK family protein [Leptospira noguchii]